MGNLLEYMERGGLVSALTCAIKWLLSGSKIEYQEQQSLVYVSEYQKKPIFSFKRTKKLEILSQCERRLSLLI